MTFPPDVPLDPSQVQIMQPQQVPGPQAGNPPGPGPRPPVVVRDRPRNDHSHPIEDIGYDPNKHHVAEPLEYWVQYEDGWVDGPYYDWSPGRTTPQNRGLRREDVRVARRESYPEAAFSVLANKLNGGVVINPDAHLDPSQVDYVRGITQAGAVPSEAVVADLPRSATISVQSPQPEYIQHPDGNITRVDPAAPPLLAPVPANGVGATLTKNAQSTVSVSLGTAPAAKITQPAAKPAAKPAVSSGQGAGSTGSKPNVQATASLPAPKPKATPTPTPVKSGPNKQA